MKLKIFSSVYYILTCTDPRRDVWKDPILTEPNKGDKSTEKRNVGGSLMTMGDGMYKYLF